MLTLTTQQLKGIIKVGDYIRNNQGQFSQVNSVYDVGFHTGYNCNEYYSYDQKQEIQFITKESMQLALAKSLQIVSSKGIERELREEKE